MYNLLLPMADKLPVSLEQRRAVASLMEVFNSPKSVESLLNDLLIAIFQVF